MRKLLIVLFSVLIFSTGFTRNQIIVGVIESPPYFEEKRPEGQGMVCELVTAAFHITGYEVIYEFYPLTRLLDTLIDGKVACIVRDIAPEEREQFIVSKPIYLSENVLFYKKSKFPSGIDFKDLTELKRYTFGIKNGSELTIKLLNDKGLTVDLANSSEQLFIKLNMDRTDFAVATDIGGLEILKIMNLNRDDFGYTKFISSSKRSMIFLKNSRNEKIISDFNIGYKTIMKNGTYKNILEKYYGAGKVPVNVLNLVNEW